MTVSMALVNAHGSSKYAGRQKRERNPPRLKNPCARTLNDGASVMPGRNVRSARAMLPKAGWYGTDV
jgi:hypothetical protein